MIKMTNNLAVFLQDEFNRRDSDMGKNSFDETSRNAWCRSVEKEILTKFLIEVSSGKLSKNEVTDAAEIVKNNLKYL